MITVALRGGLGNQMFQYAAGLSFAKKNKTELVLDTVFLNDRFPRRNFTYRTFDLDVFTLDPKLTRLSKASAKAPIPGVWLALDLLLVSTRSIMGIQKKVREISETVFQPNLLSAQDNIFLWGRWQNEKYFADYADDVRAAFAFRDAPFGQALDIAKTIASTNSVSLHVRRSDYVVFKNVENLMGKTDTGYYARAVAHIAERVQHPHFFIFSDDIAWCKENIKLSFPATYIDRSSEGLKGAFHLQLMSLCKYNIIANSTFSWWGAWLNANPEKIVVAPEKWERGPFAARRGGDVVPEGWVIL
jgi:hypothetical protein